MFDKSTSQVAQRLKTDMRFVKNWVDHPLKTGAIAPSGNALARAMASFVPIESNLPVLEIGPGTGAVTRALLERGISTNRLMTLEFNSEFCAHIRKNFPDVKVIQGDAYALTNTLKVALGEIPKFAAIVSSLPLLTRGREHREALLRESLQHLHSNAPFIQFSYGFHPPIEAPEGVSMEKTAWIIRNIPPARVFVYR